MKRYSKEFKEEALKLSDEIGVKKAAQQLGIHRNTLEYQVRKMNAVIGGQPDEQKRFMMMCTYKMLALPDAGVPEL